MSMLWHRPPGSDRLAWRADAGLSLSKAALYCDASALERHWYCIYAVFPAGWAPRRGMPLTRKLFGRFWRSTARFAITPS